MASVSVTNTFAAATVISSSQVNANFTDIVNYINNRNSASSMWDSVSISNASSVPLIVNNSTGTQNIANFLDNGSVVFSITDAALASGLTSTGLGVGTASPTVAMDVIGVIAPRESTKSRYGGLVTEASSTLISFGINDGTSNRFGSSYTQADQGGLIRIDTRSGQSLFQIMGRAAAAASDVSALLQINSAGITTIPLQSGCRVSRITSDQSITANTTTKVQFNSETYDVQSEFDSATNYNFTATVAGKYLVTSTLNVSGTSGDQIIVSIFVNGAAYSQSANFLPVGASLTTTISEVLSLSATNTVDIRVKDPSNNCTVTAGAAPALSWLAVEKIA